LRPPPARSLPHQAAPRLLSAVPSGRRARCPGRRRGRQPRAPYSGGAAHRWRLGCHCRGRADRRGGPRCGRGASGRRRGRLGQPAGARSGHRRGPGRPVCGTDGSRGGPAGGGECRVHKWGRGPGRSSAGGARGGRAALAARMDPSAPGARACPPLSLALAPEREASSQCHPAAVPHAPGHAHLLPLCLELPATNAPPRQLH
jgi:hypothetical protein